MATVAAQTTGNLVEVEDLRKAYGKLEAVRGVSFSIPAGSIFGLLGPNGAGKTSIIEMIEGLRVPDQGRIRVAGLDPLRQARQRASSSERNCRPPRCRTRSRWGKCSACSARFTATPSL